MKKLLALLLTGAMTFSMAACGSNGEPASSADHTGNTGSADATEESQTVLLPEKERTLPCGPIR